MHKYFMLAALEQAKLGQGSCAPNPCVGAVAVHQNEIIARAHHQGVGTAHAEQLLLEQLPKDLTSVSLYVTLEPCNHWGRTPPCVLAISNYGISEVIFGFCDPNPLVAENNTPAILQNKGIKTTFFPLPEIDAFYQSYRYWTLNKMPWVTVKLAHTLDAKIAGSKGQRLDLTNAECAYFTHQKRSQADVLLTTAKTIIQDDPLLNVRLEGKEEGKLIAILDSKLSLNSDAKVFQTAKYCFIYHEEGRAITQPIANCSYHPIPCEAGLLNLSAVIRHLGQLGFHDVWVEVGSQCFAALHREQLVQRTYLYLAPLLLGQKAQSAFTEDGLFAKKPQVSWQIKADNVIACLDWQEDSCLPE